MDNGWVKHFIDGTIEHGSDLLVEQGKASWSRGRLEGIDRVEIWHQGRFIAIQGPGEYWQSDTFEVGVLESDSQLVSRTIYRKFYPENTHMRFEEVLGSRFISVGFPELADGDGHVMKVSHQWCGLWLKLDMSVENLGTSCDVVMKPGGM